MNLEAEQIALVLQVRDSLPIEIEHIVQKYGKLSPERLLALSQQTFWRHDGSIEPSILEVL